MPDQNKMIINTLGDNTGPGKLNKLKIADMAI